MSDKLDLHRLADMPGCAPDAQDFKSEMAYYKALLEWTLRKGRWEKELKIAAPALLATAREHLDLLAFVRNHRRVIAHGSRCGIMCEENCLCGKLAALVKDKSDAIQTTPT